MQATALTPGVPYFRIFKTSEYNPFSNPTLRKKESSKELNYSPLRSAKLSSALTAASPAKIFSVRLSPFRVIYAFMKLILIIGNMMDHLSIKNTTESLRRLISNAFASFSPHDSLTYSAFLHFCAGLGLRTQESHLRQIKALFQLKNNNIEKTQLSKMAILQNIVRKGKRILMCDSYNQQQQLQQEWYAVNRISRPTQQQLVLIVNALLLLQKYKILPVRPPVTKQYLLGKVNLLQVKDNQLMRMGIQRLSKISEQFNLEQVTQFLKLQKIDCNFFHCSRQREKESKPLLKESTISPQLNRETVKSIRTLPKPLKKPKKLIKIINSSKTRNEIQLLTSLRTNLTKSELDLTPHKKPFFRKPTLPDRRKEQFMFPFSPLISER